MKARLTKNITANALGFSLLAGTEFEILSVGNGYVVTKNLLIDFVWNDEFEIIE